MTSKFLGKTGALRHPYCGHCDLPCKSEQYEFTHTFVGAGGEKEKAIKLYCSIECMREDMGINEHILYEVETRTKKELNWLHKQVCPSCTRRITSVI